MLRLVSGWIGRTNTAVEGEYLFLLHLLESFVAFFSLSLFLGTVFQDPRSDLHTTNIVAHYRVVDVLS